MLKILWKREEIAPEEQRLLLSTIFCYLMLDFYVKTRIRFSLRDKRLKKRLASPKLYNRPEVKSPPRIEPGASRSSV